MEDHFIAIDLRIDSRPFLQGHTNRLGKEGHKA